MLSDKKYLSYFVPYKFYSEKELSDLSVRVEKDFRNATALYQFVRPLYTERDGIVVAMNEFFEKAKNTLEILAERFHSDQEAAQ